MKESANYQACRERFHSLHYLIVRRYLVLLEILNQHISTIKQDFFRRTADGFEIVVERRFILRPFIILDTVYLTIVIFLQSSRPSNQIARGKCTQQSTCSRLVYHEILGWKINPF